MVARTDCILQKGMLDFKSLTFNFIVIGTIVTIQNYVGIFKTGN